MRFTVLYGRFSGRLFGFQVKAGRYVLQFADGRLGLFDSVAYHWFF